MVSFSNNIQRFILGERVEANVFDCKMCFIESDLSIDASALHYQCFKDAEKVYKVLCQIKSPYVTKPLGLGKYGGDEGMVIVEKILPFSVWLDDTEKLGMWKIFGDDQTYLGLGKAFQTKFRQIMLGLEAIHKFPYRHGNLMYGVFTGNNGNIQLSNFLTFSVDDQSLKQDFRDFVSLVETAISIHPVPELATKVAGVNIQQCEVDQLKSLLNFCLGQSNDFDASLMYGATILWGGSQKRQFFSRLNDLLQQTGRHLCHFAPPTGSWWTNISSTNSLYEVLDHLVGKKGRRNGWFIMPAGIVVLIRNYCEHSPAAVDPFNEIERTFTGIAGKIYNALVEVAYWNETLTWLTPPAHHQDKQVLIQDRFGMIGQLSYPISKTVREYIMEEAAIWWKD